MAHKLGKETFACRALLGLHALCMPRTSAE